MNRDPFLRLALVALCAGLILGLYLVGHRYGTPAAVLVGGLGALAALLLSLEYQPGPPSRDELKDQLRPSRPRTDSAGRPQGFERIP